jgi:DNA topoisomerase III
MCGAQEEDLGGDMWRIYEYITRHFIGTITSNCKYVKTRAVFQIGSETFKCSGKRVISPGFTEVMPWLRVSDTQIPDLTGVKTCPLVEVVLRSGKTAPPDYLTESELIGLVNEYCLFGV